MLEKELEDLFENGTNKSKEMRESTKDMKEVPLVCSEFDNYNVCNIIYENKRTQ